ncbi:hypothetical protein JV46_25770 [Solemya velum gill symbiont]|uniref:Uncharacterized protein n=1 Tax=Solemya velum gill symbiont TaxID=2340 RepID=A0A0B0H616_SOVGS|nr:hypothetical protein JV46_25770 [Solemya velum gill symbiont]
MTPRENTIAVLTSKLSNSNKNHGNSEQSQKDADENQSDEKPDIDSKTSRLGQNGLELIKQRTKLVARCKLQMR